MNSILEEYDKQFIEMQDEFVNILTSIKNCKDINQIKNICNSHIDIIKKYQEIGNFNNIYNMKGELI